MSAVMWDVVWENDLTDQQHRGLALLLARSFPRHASLFGGARSWFGAWPEVRVVGSVDGVPLACCGVLRRFLRVPARGASLLVGEVGLVAVDPRLRGTGVGRELLGRAAALLHELDTPFGFLTCHARVVPFYERGGWTRVDGGVRLLDWDHRDERYTGEAMVLAVRAAIADWPHGELVVRDGTGV